VTVQPTAQAAKPAAVAVQAGHSRLGRIAARLRGGRTLGPGMALYLLAPVIAELCSGSTPPLTYIYWWPVLILMYGGGAVLIREAALRWGKSWPTILALGVAYAIAEEGIAVRTFFDPTAPQVQSLGEWGWAGGANWPWITHLAMFHAVISIAVPIFLVMLAYPERRSEPWVDRRWLAKAAAGFVGIELFWLLAYRRPVEGVYMVASLVAILGFVLLARLLPASFGRRHDRAPAGVGTLPLDDARSAPSPRRVAVIAFAAMTATFAVVWSRGFGGSPAAAVGALLVIATVAGAWFVRGSSRPVWNDRHRYAIAAGMVSFLVLLSPLVEVQGGRGEIFVGIALAWALRRTWARLRAASA
jgi:hypothetical protein